MIDFQLAPFIIAGLLVVTGYMFTRWLSNLGQLNQAMAVAISLQDTIDAMRAEGCRAMSALQNIFNGVTAGGMPHSKLVQKVADVATDALLLCAPCEHKAQAEEMVAVKLDAENWQNLAVESEAQAEEWKDILDNFLCWAAAPQPHPSEGMNGYARATRWVLDRLHLFATERDTAMVRAHEAERLLGLANDKLIVAESQRADSTPPLPYERGDVPEADD